MDLKEARKALAGPLLFGNAAQVEAVQFISRAESCLAAIEACTHGSGACEECDGKGECRHCGHECEECGGTGTASPCSCLDEFDGEALKAAVELDMEKPFGVGRVLV